MNYQELKDSIDGLVPTQRQTLGKVLSLAARGGAIIPEFQAHAEAATYFTTLQGEFTCAGLELSGMFDVFKADSTLILEQWNLGENGFRARTTDLANTHGFISMY